MSAPKPGPPLAKVQRPDTWDGYDAVHDKIVAAYREEPYTARDPHGLFTHVLDLTRLHVPGDWSDLRCVMMATAVVGTVHAEYDASQQPWKPV